MCTTVEFEFGPFEMGFSHLLWSPGTGLQSQHLSDTQPQPGMANDGDGTGRGSGGGMPGNLPAPAYYLPRTSIEPRPQLQEKEKSRQIPNN